MPPRAPSAAPLALLISASLALHAPAADRTDPFDAPDPAKPRAPVTISPLPERPFEIAAVDDLLTALEHGDRGVDTFSAKILYDRIFELQGDRHVRYGELHYRVDTRPAQASAEGRPSRSFAVLFRKLHVDGAIRDDRQDWLFDGRWLVEKRYDAKQFVKRQIAAPGERVDPLRLGEGPLTLPVGQKKDEILARYDAELLPADAGFTPEQTDTHVHYIRHVRGAYQLSLTPRAHFADESEFTSIRLWYRPDAQGRLVPLLSRTLDRKGDESIVMLIGVKLNEPVPAGVIDLTEPPPGSGWDVQIERRRAAEPTDRTGP